MCGLLLIDRNDILSLFGVLSFNLLRIEVFDLLAT
jgi:hypothetical protein